MNREVCAQNHAIDFFSSFGCAYQFIACTTARGPHSPVEISIASLLVFLILRSFGSRRFVFFFTPFAAE